MKFKPVHILFIFLYVINAKLGLCQGLPNDDCKTAIFIPDVDDYCSKAFEFTNAGATQSSTTRPSCWPQFTEDSDVWFSFIPKNLDVFIQLTGQTGTKEGTLQKPSVAVYRGSCNNLVEVACGSVLFEENVVELTVADLQIGSTYYIRVDGREKNTGTFKLCINTFVPTRPPEADCDKGIILCDKEEIFVKNIAGAGQNKNEVDPKSCLTEEFASVWYKWTCKDPGTLTFEIKPNNPADDIDFAVFKLPGGLDDCKNKETVRCMASGETIGQSEIFNKPCFGTTGLSLTAKDLTEFAGCQQGDDNFVKNLDMKAGESYTLLINNYSRSGQGFSIKWGGTGTFLGPEVDFNVESQNKFECDKSVLFTNKSKSATDPISSFQWSFGNGSNPSSSKANIVDVVYNSFGDKKAALTVETTRGCIVTKIIDLFINACCADTSTLDVSAKSNFIPCFNDKTGQIDANGKNGSPEYSFSLDNKTYVPVGRFSGLAAGNFRVYIRDIKGCLDSTELVINQAPAINVDAGDDIKACLGGTAKFNGSAFGGTGKLIPQWIPADSIRAPNEFDSEFIPINNKSYILQVTDDNGCTNSDIVNVTVEAIRDIFTPNILKYEVPGPNGYFFIYGGKSTRKIKQLEVYDRWGNKMFEKKDFPLNSYTEGWNGDFNGSRVVAGVYTWIATIEYLDDVELTFTGDVTVSY